MARTLDEVISTLSPERRAKIEARAAELIAEEKSLRELRKAVGKTQETIAKRMNVGQEAVSKIETRTDMKISTLVGFVGAMDGHLDLIVRLPNLPAIRLEGLGTVVRHRTRAAPVERTRTHRRKRAATPEHAA